jgi:glycosyltransferase involved in cell wall biosynthesis
MIGKSETIEAAVITTHIEPAFGYGGPSVSVAVLATTWAKMGHKLVLCSSNASDAIPLSSEDVEFGDNINVTLYPSQWFKRWGFGLRAITFIFKICKKAPFVYINGVATWPTSLAALFCCLIKRHFVVSLRGGLMAEHVNLIKKKKIHKWIFYKLLTFPTLRRSAAIHCTSTIEADAASHILDHNSRVAVIPNGVDTERIRAKGMPDCNGLIFCYAGRISIEKGINVFIKAWLKRKRSVDKMVVAGSGYGNYYKKFQMLVKKSRGAVIYKGYLFREELLRTISDCHILILPSGIEGSNGWESFGNIVAEAFALGRPVMATRGLAWDHIEINNIGFLFNRQFDSVCETIKRVQSLNIREIQHMGTTARAYAKENLDSYVLAKRLWALVRDL